MIPGLLNCTRMAFMRRVGALANQHLTRNLFTLNGKSIGELENSVRMRAPYTKHDWHCSLPLAESCQIPGNIVSVKYDEIKNIRQHRNKLLIDVREESEIDSGLIPGSINIPLSVLEKELSNRVNPEDFYNKYGVPKPHEKTDIITSCFSGQRAQLAAGRVLGLGYKKVRHYSGSWQEYARLNNIKKPKK